MLQNLTWSKVVDPKVSSGLRRIAEGFEREAEFKKARLFYSANITKAAAVLRKAMADNVQLMFPELKRIDVKSDDVPIEIQAFLDLELTRHGDLSTHEAEIEGNLIESLLAIPIGGGHVLRNNAVVSFDSNFDVTDSNDCEDTKIYIPNSIFNAEGFTKG